MTLLAPWTALAAGLIGGGLLLVMYMLRLRRRPVRVTTTMFWGDPPRDLEANVPLRMVRPAWTLLLQALAVAMLALALGRPATEAGVGSVDEVYILIDRSASMNALDGGGGRSRLDAARDAALDVVSGVGGLGGARALVVAFASRAEAVTSMTSDRGALSAAIGGIEAADEAGDLGAALDLVGALIASRAGERDAPAAARVAVLSDGSFERGAARSLAGAAIEFRTMGSIRAVRGDADQGGAGVAPEQGGGRNNVAITALAAQRDIGDPARVRVFARLISVRGVETPVTVTLRLDGAELARRAVVVPALSTPDDGGAGGPGDGESARPAERSVSLEFTQVSGGVLTASIDRDDLLPGDNRAAIVVPPVQRPRIVLVSPGEADPFLMDVLEALPPAWLRSISAAQYESPLGAELGEQADLVVFDRVRPGVLPGCASISFGAGVPVAGLDGTPEDARPPTASAGDAAPLISASQWDRGHPALASVTLDGLRVSKAIPLRVGGVGGAVDGAPGSTEANVDGTPARVLAWGLDGPLMVETREGGVRRIVVGFALHDSNWPLSVGFAIFLSAAIDDLVYAGSPGRGVSYDAGSLIAPPELTGQSLEVRDAEGRVMARGLGSVVVPRAGLYTLAGAGGERPLAVNVAGSHESMVLVEPRLRIAGEELAGATGAAHPTELWFWFVLGAGVLLLIEWIVYLLVARV
ncbi:MAG: VWA domain-containing protein [Phycisphaerales bacterium]|nr:VWA domain-containing protein [Phycisphaerales bacterium]